MRWLAILPLLSLFSIGCVSRETCQQMQQGVMVVGEGGKQVACNEVSEKDDPADWEQCQEAGAGGIQIGQGALRIWCAFRPSEDVDGSEQVE